MLFKADGAVQGRNAVEVVVVLAIYPANVAKLTAQS